MTSYKLVNTGFNILKYGFLILLLIAQVYGQRCPYGWLNRAGSDSCYLVTHDDVPYTWKLATDRCQSLQGELVIIGDESEKKWLISQLSRIQQLYNNTNEWWIGFIDRHDGKGFVWADNTPVNSKLVTINPTKPDTDPICGRLNNLNFDAVKCSYWRHFICERSKAVPIKCEIDEGWINVNDKCYKLFDSKRSFNGAGVKCELADGMLATVGDSSVQTFLWGLAKKNGANVWFGLSTVKQGTKYKWQWKNSTDLDPQLSYWWKGTTPTQQDIKKTNGSCAQIMTDATVKRKFSWKASDCSEIKGFVCEKAQGVCEPGWLIHQGYCYQVHAGSLARSWDTANSYCTQQGGNLLKIKSAADQLFVDDHILSQAKRGLGGVWIGIVDNGQAGKFKWSDGSAIGKSLENWANGKPTNTPKRDCGYIDTNDVKGRWQTSNNCAQSKQFVCQIAVNQPVKKVTLAPETYTCSGTGWVPFGKYCYKFNDKDSTWLDSRRSCQSIPGSDLIRIEDHDLQTFINVEITKRKGDYWIGLHDRPSEGKYLWLDDTTTITKADFNNWAKTEPNNLFGAENCVSIAGTKGASRLGRWYDYPCSRKFNFVCQKPADDSGITLPPPTMATMFNPKCGLFWEDNPHSPYCYQFQEELLSWFDADDACKHHGGTLASITSIQEQFYISGRVKEVKTMAMWLGASDRSLEGGWRWEDGSPFAFINWDAGAPNNYKKNEDCGAMFVYSSRWNDYQCTTRHGYICKKLGVVKSTTTQATTVPTNIPDGKVYGCPPGWREYRSSCYIVIRDSKNWLDSRTYCRQNGGDLASILDQEENNFVFSQTPAVKCFNVHGDDAKCTEWAKRGECTNNPIWMAKNCRTACNLCYSKCKNTHRKNSECVYWASHGECTKNPLFMLKQCMQSCKVCDGGQYDAVWIGLNDRQSNVITRQFVWSDGSPVSFTEWDVGEPNNYRGKRENCIKMFTQKAESPGAWSDDDCDSLLNGFVCKTKKSVQDKSVVTNNPLAVGCPKGQLGYESRCYNLMSTAMTWNDAEEKCVSLNGHLATINNRFVQAFLAAELVNKDDIYWIGLSNTQSSYKWSSNEPLLYTAWDRFHTGNENSTCVGMNTSHPVGLWTNVNCSMQESFICDTLREGYSTPIITTQPSTTPHTSCPTGWSEYLDSCYKSISTSLNWFDARKYCMNMGGDLASFVNASAQNVIKSDFSRFGYWSQYWIGLNDLDTEGKYKWSDGTPEGFFAWNSGEPNDISKREDCVELNKGRMKWNDNNCYIPQKFICRIGRGINISIPLTPVATQAPVACADKDWFYFNGSCYYISPKYSGQKSWYESERYCLSQGGHLTSIHSIDEDNFLMSQLLSRSTSNSVMWIGLNELQGSYKWSDNTLVSYKSWSSGEPNDAYGGQRCVNMYSRSGSWNDDNCMDSFGFICKKLNLSSSIAPPTQAPLVNGGCPTNFRAAEQSNKCFYVGGLSFEGSKQWEVARNACRSFGYGYDIATISSKYEQDFVLTLLNNLNKTGVWIGLFDIHINGKFTWSDNSELAYTNWGKGEPSDHWSYSRFNREDCVEIRLKEGEVGKWNDQKCTDQRPYVCHAWRDVKLPKVPHITLVNCQSGYTAYSTGCYKLVNQLKTWKDAQIDCRLDGPRFNLVSILSAFEQAYIDILTSSLNSSYWIGLSDTQVKGIYNWANGWPKSFSNWGGDEPSKGDGEGCVAVVNGKWNDTVCDSKYPYICMQNTAPLPPTTPMPTGRCADPTWKMFGDYCYFADFENSKSWPEARYMCQQRGMQLATIQTKEESMFVKQLVQSVPFTTRRYGYFRGSGSVSKIWIGLNKVQNSGFQWIDSSPLLYTSWAKGEPSDTDAKQHEDCVEMYKDSGLWNDVDCFANKAYVCKAKRILLTSVLPPTISSSLRSSVTSSKPDTYYVDTKTNAHRAGPTSPAVSGLTGGQIAGIVIGIIGCGIIIAVFLFVAKRFQTTKSIPNNDSVGFDNALYTKTNGELDCSSNEFHGNLGVIRIGNVQND